MTDRFRHILASLEGHDNYNLHSHTQWCDGRAPIAEMAEAAVGAGMTHYGFSPHSPLAIPSPCNMSAADVGAYLAEVERLRGVHAGRCELYAAMEIDYLGPHWGPSSDYFQSLPLDYRIGSVHFIPNRQGEYYDVDGSPERFARYVAEKFDGDLHYVVNTFFDQTMAMVGAGGFDIIGHLDKIGYNASQMAPGIDREPWFADRVNAVIDAVADADIAVEINTKSRDERGRFFPDTIYWERIVGRGIPVVVNSDAHYPGRICSGRAEAFRLLGRITDGHASCRKG